MADMETQHTPAKNHKTMTNKKPEQGPMGEGKYSSYTGHHTLARLPDVPFLRMHGGSTFALNDTIFGVMGSYAFASNSGKAFQET